MNKTPLQLEQLLDTQKEVSLTATEKSVMFSELQAFVELHTPTVVAPIKRKQTSIWAARWAVGVVGIFLVFIGTGYAATQSLPGEPLYAVKVSVVEPFIGLRYVHESDQLAYQINLMERRLEEMETLYRADILTEGAVITLEEQISEQAEDFKDLITITSPANISPEVTVEAVSEVVVTLRKQNLLIEKELGDIRPSILDDIEVRVDDLYDVEVAEFITTKPDAVTGYVEELLNEVDEQVVADPATASSSAVELNEYLKQVEETLEDGNFTEAIESAEEATQLLEANSFSETLSESVTEGT